MPSPLKAVKITKNNKPELEAQYSMSEDFLEYSSGLYLVAGFGDTQYHGILTRVGLHAQFNVTGNELANGFFEITKKESV